EAEAEGGYGALGLAEASHDEIDVRVGGWRRPGPRQRIDKFWSAADELIWVRRQLLSRNAEMLRHGHILWQIQVYRSRRLAQSVGNRALKRVVNCALRQLVAGLHQGRVQGL